MTPHKIDWATSPLTYSTSEVDTGAKWIDGKAIFVKTIDFGVLPNATVKNVPHGISGLGRLIRLEGRGRGSSGTNYILAPMVSAVSGNALGGAVVDSTNVSFASNTNLNPTVETAYFTLFYTKA